MDNRNGAREFVAGSPAMEVVSFLSERLARVDLEELTRLVDDDDGAGVMRLIESQDIGPLERERLIRILSDVGFELRRRFPDELR